MQGFCARKHLLRDRAAAPGGRLVRAGSGRVDAEVAEEDPGLLQLDLVDARDVGREGEGDGLTGRDVLEPVEPVHVHVVGLLRAHAEADALALGEAQRARAALHEEGRTGARRWRRLGRGRGLLRLHAARVLGGGGGGGGGRLLAAVALVVAAARHEHHDGDHGDQRGDAEEGEALPAGHFLQTRGVLVRGDVVIGQPAHAWVSGQLARAWGNAAFPAPVPRDAVCLAADQHDVGWSDADLAPLLDAESGRPRPFTAVPRPYHLRVWGGAAARLLAQSRYAALLVSLHGTGLYERLTMPADPEVAAAVTAYLEGQRALQAELSAGLDPAEVERNRALLRCWDSFSLALCLPRLPWRLEGVPAADGEAAIVLDGDGAEVTVDPWPFAAERVVVACEGRRLPGAFADEADLHAALAAAPWEPLRWELTPARGPVPPSACLIP